MALQYIGARYVPKFDGDYDATKTYEPLTVVNYNGSSYTSKKIVPAGILPTNSDYWAETGLYNGQIAALSERVDNIENGINTRIIFMPNTVLTPPSSGNGACTVFITRLEKKVIMFDSGKSADYGAIKSELIKNNIHHIDYFILSHYHGDHWGNIQNLQADLYIDSSTVVYLPRDTNAVPGWDVIQEQVRGYFANNTVITISSSMPLNIDGINFDFINCDESDFTHYENEGDTEGNTYSIAAYVNIDNFVLFMGGDLDSTALSYNASLDRFKHCNVMNLPHHGINSGSSSEIIFRSYPDATISQFAAGGEYQHDNYLDAGGHYGTSNKIAMCNALNIKSYCTGYGAVYLTVDDDVYTLLSNDKALMSYRTQYITLYLAVDASFTGKCYGTTLNPFNTIQQAIAYANDMHVESVIINIQGEYDYPDEIVEISNTSTIIHLRGALSGGVPTVTINSVIVNNSTVILDKIEFANADTGAAVYADYSNVYVTECLIDGDTSALTNAYEGVAIKADKISHILCNKTTFNNKNVVFYNMEGSTIECIDSLGSGNNYLASGTLGFKTSLSGSSITYNKFIGARYNAHPSSDLIVVNRKYAYSSYGPFIAFTDSVSAATSETLDFSHRMYYNKIFKIYCSNGAVYQVNKTSGNLSTPELIQTAFDSSDPSFAVSVSGSSMTVSYQTMVKVIAI